MSEKIDQKIVAYKVVTEVKEEPAVVQEELQPLESMHEKLERPEILLGSTYKLKTNSESYYITINNIVLNAGTEHQSIRPMEIFINSKNMEHYQWVTALTRVISAVFRKSGDIVFLAEELKGIFDPKGGSFKKGRFVPSLVADIGYTIELHYKVIGLMPDDSVDEKTREFLEAKRKEFNALHGDVAIIAETGEFPAQAVLCNKCHAKALVLMDGCMTCLNCGDSKCG